jgi:hypothetical protein
MRGLGIIIIRIQFDVTARFRVSSEKKVLLTDIERISIEHSMMSSGISPPDVNHNDSQSV